MRGSSYYRHFSCPYHELIELHSSCPNGFEWQEVENWKMIVLYLYGFLCLQYYARARLPSSFVSSFPASCIFILLRPPLTRHSSSVVAILIVWIVSLESLVLVLLHREKRRESLPSQMARWTYLKRRWLRDGCGTGSQNHKLYLILLFYLIQIEWAK